MFTYCMVYKCTKWPDMPLKPHAPMPEKYTTPMQYLHFIYKTKNIWDKLCSKLRSVCF